MNKLNKIELLYGFAIGIILAALGVYLFISIFTDLDFLHGIQVMQARNSIGKLITIGAILNLGMFFIFIKFSKDLMARGVLLATIVLAIITIFV